MQILKLTFAGLGPYVDEQTIDFTDVGADGLFLLTGPTGAGKTTIIDAIVFALYGDVAGGASSDKARLVSTFLPDGVQPCVELTFESPQGLLKVRRTPAYTRLKQRGTGTTPVGPTCTVWRMADLDTEGDKAYTGIQEANDFLANAIGLSKEQFTQTVVLPQGQFADFLRATSDERTKVLEKIFGTEYYTRLMAKLKELAAEHTRNLKDAETAFGSVASGFCQVSWDAEDSPDGDPFAEQQAFDEAVDAGEHAEVLKRAIEQEEILAIRALEALNAAEAASAVRDEAQEAFDEAKRVVGLQAKWADLTKRQAELAAQTNEIAGWRQAVDCAREAARLRPYRDRADASTTAAAEAAEALAIERRGLADDVDGDLAADAMTVEALGDVSRALRTQLGALASLADTEAGLETRRVQAIGTADQLAESKEGLTHDEAALAELEAAIAEAKASAVSIEGLTADRLALKGEREKASACVDAFVKADALTAQLADDRAAETDREAAHTRALADHAALRQCWLDGLAGTLAADLSPDAACPVCGSLDHPQPAAPPPAEASKEAVDAAWTQVTDAAQTLARARGVVSQTASALEAARLAAGEGDLAAAEATVAGIDEQISDLDDALAEAREAAAQLVTAEKQLAAATKKLADQRLVLARRETALEAERTAIAADEARVAENTGEFTSIADRVARLTERTARADRLITLLRTASQTRSDADQRVSEFAAELAGSVLSADQIDDASMPPAELTEAEQTIAKHDRETHSDAPHLSSPEFQRINDITVDLAAAEDACAKASEAQRNAERTSGRLAKTATSSSRALADLRGKYKHLENLQKTIGPYVRMADLATAGAGNESRVSLPTFVLMRQFAEVIDMANVRLQAMTFGRYELRRSDAAEGRERKVGLGLEVIDHEMPDSQARNPRTLSGGETFQASLALALGLADAVTAEAGGIELNTMFIDEGFGTLDDESRDEVMNQLADLRAGGRMIGIISHVTELRQLIGDQIIVRKNDDGTSTLTATSSL